MKVIEYSRIFYKINQFGRFNMYFLDEKKRKMLYFDGIDFYLLEQPQQQDKSLSELEYTRLQIHNNLSINKIKQFEEVTFIQMNNGDIFQIYSMFDDENANQKLSIFDESTKKISTPLGISAYDAALKRINDANNIEIKNQI